ncbi:hypothetical protein GWI33_015739 [Rhynchophorus ferrugineus]|uniref:Uncharacterized protein n=1 Tax=Rhynchophorus ferrugineus TaxID=354439 RepID=A0A834I1X1_RHYFE|nr:hypothetical protein GWI33_015739 [Rhynchophorus ferrugineus]
MCDLGGRVQSNDGFRLNVLASILDRELNGRPLKRQVFDKYLKGFLVSCYLNMQRLVPLPPLRSCRLAGDVDDIGHLECLFITENIYSLSLCD